LNFLNSDLKIILLLFLVCFGGGIFAQQNDSILSVLDKELRIQESYVDRKYDKITQLKESVERNLLKDNRRNLYGTYLKLFNEYKSFKYDSAYLYVEKAKNIAYEIKDDSLISETKIKEGFVLISAGLFKEGIDTLNSISIRQLAEKDKYDYYYTKARSYFDLANYNYDERFRVDYIKLGNSLLEEALKNTAPNMPDFWAAESLRRLKQQDWAAAKKSYLYWINNFDLPPDQYGVATSSLSYVYAQTGFKEKAIEYLAEAAISDVRSGTKENIALRNLANEFYGMGKLERANKYVHLAMDDATFYDARHRKVEISSILPIIESAQLYQVEEKNSILKKVVILLSVLALIVLIFVGIIFKQLKEKNKARKALNIYNLRLEEVNSSLLEADAIKQDYISYFLKVTSDLINKIGNIQKSTIHKIKTRHPEEVLNVLKRYSVKSERNDLFHQFDLVFLKLFPPFIEEFNKLFTPEEQKFVKKDELLNTELRIFALYRLGIQDSQRVADFLDISVATVYTYKTRVKGKSKYRNNFEEKIMEIKRLK